MSNGIRVGVVGVGSVAEKYIPQMQRLNIPRQRVDIAVVCDAKEDRRAVAQERYGLDTFTTDYREVVNDPSIDLVLVLTSMQQHWEIAKAAVEAGKHVLVEKPMTLTTRDAVELNRIARQQGRVLMVGHLLEYHPAVSYIKQMIDSGDLGEVYYLYSQRLNHGKVRSDENAWWSLAPHDVSVALRLLGGWPLSVQLRGQNVVQKDIADVVFATLEFPGGKLAHMHVSWLDPHKTRKLTVVGSRKMVVFDDTLPAYKVTVYDKCFKINQPVASYADWITMHQGDIVVPKMDATEPLLREAKHFVECVRTGQKPLSDGESGALVVSVLEYGQRSLESGLIVPIPPAESEQAVRMAG